MANTFKFGNGNWAVKDGYALAYNDENNNFKPLPFDFTRASSATALNRQGLVETVGSGKPRIDFLDNTSGHLLLEPSRTNLFTYSEDFTQSNWAKVNSTLLSNQIVSPDGSQTADLLTSTAATGGIFEFNEWTTTQRTATFFVKKNTAQFVEILNASASGNRVKYDLDNGIIDTESGSMTGTIVNYGNGWYRLSATHTHTGTGTFGLRFLTSGESVYIWGAQIEAGSYATSYIPTEGSSVTRVVENTANGGNSETIGSSTGTVFIDLKDTNTIGGSANTDVMVIKNSSNIALGLYSLFIHSTGNIRLYNVIGNTSVTLKSGDNRGQSLKIAFAYANADFVAYVNGVKTFESSSVSLQSGLDFIGLNASPNEGLTVVNEVKLYDTRLTDTELQNLTS